MRLEWTFYWHYEHRGLDDRTLYGIGWLGSVSYRVKVRDTMLVLELLSPCCADKVYREDWGTGCDFCASRLPAYAAADQVTVERHDERNESNCKDVIGLLASWAALGGIEPLTASLEAEEAFSLIQDRSPVRSILTLDGRDYKISKEIERRVWQAGLYGEIGSLIR